jgi:hypothetical protein
MAESAKKLAAYTGSNLAYAQDGGKAHTEIAKSIPADKYIEITKEFFLA